MNQPEDRTLIDAAYAHVDAMKPRADGDDYGAPWWHGWAVRGAFVAGAEHGAGPTVFVVMGSVGEYEDRREWAVDAYLTRAEADARDAQLTELQSELGTAMRIVGFKHLHAKAKQAYRERSGDPHFDLDAQYGVEQVPLGRKVDTAAKP